MASQQGTLTDYATRPVQAYLRPELEGAIDSHIRCTLYTGNRAPMPVPLNYYGRNMYRPPPPEAHSHVPGALSGVYMYQGPVLEPYGIEPKLQVMVP
jgi:hypothetical protein